MDTRGPSSRMREWSRWQNSLSLWLLPITQEWNCTGSREPTRAGICAISVSGKFLQDRREMRIEMCITLV